MNRKKLTSPERLLTLDSRIHFTPRGPWEPKRASFTLICGEYLPSGKKKSRTILTPEIIDLNERYRRREITVEQGRKELETLRDGLYQKIKEQQNKDLNKSNVELVESFISNVLDKKVDILPSSIVSQKYAAWQVARAFGQASIARAEVREIQKVLDSIKKEGAFKHAFTTTRALLKYIHRHNDADKLRSREFDKKEPPFLTPDQVQQLISRVPAKDLADYPMIRELIQMVFQLGTRIGETLALEKTDLARSSGTLIVRITKQYVKSSDADRDGERIRRPKNKRSRDVIPLDGKVFFECFQRWLSANPKPEDREKYRHKVSRLVHELCEELFLIKLEDVNEEILSEDDIPELSDLREYKGIHMLRASHAKYLVELTGNTTFAANQIGDNPEVMRKHYSGSTNSKKAIEIMAKILKPKTGLEATR